MNKVFFRVCLVLAILVLGLLLFFAGFRKISDGYMGVEILAIGKEKVSERPLTSGWHWRRPLMVEIQRYNMTEQMVEVALQNVSTTEKKSLDISCQLYYQLQADKLVDLHKRFSNGYSIQTKVTNFLQAKISETVQKYSRGQIFGASRPDFKAELESGIKKEFDLSGVKINNLLISNLRFPDQYTRDIERFYPSQMTPVSLKKLCYSKEKSAFTVHLNVYYHIEPKDAEGVHNRLGTGYVNSILVPNVKSSLDSLTTNYTLDEIYQSNSREKVTESLLLALRKDAVNYNIQIDDVRIEALSFSKSYQNLLEEIQRAERQVQRLSVERKLIEEKARNRRIEKEREYEEKRREAEAEQQAQLIHAKGVRESELLKAEGKAEALLKVQKVISENPSILRYLYLDKISDKVKVIVVPAGENGLPLSEALQTIEKKGE